MFAALAKNRYALLLVACHLLAIAVSIYFKLHYFPWARSLAAGRAFSTALLIVAGADLGLLSLWGALCSCRPVVRRIVIGVCIVGWGFVYSPDMTWWLIQWSYVRQDWHYYQYPFFNDLAASFGPPLLTIAGITCALGVVKRRGGTLRRLAPDELQRESGCRQFQISHLLLLTAVLAIVLGASLNGREFFSRQISMRWQSPAEAPIYSAETVLFSAFCLSTTALATAWAVLGLGRPWLRLLMAWATASLLGGAWAFAFTSPRHQEFLASNAAFSAGVALLQAVLMTVVLLIVRSRGYRFAPDADEPPRDEGAWHAAIEP